MNRSHRARRSEAAAYAASVGANDGNIIAAIITIQDPVNQPSVPSAVPGPAHAGHPLGSPPPREAAGDQQPGEDLRVLAGDGQVGSWC